jgi:hypothetical protein
VRLRFSPALLIMHFKKTDQKVVVPLKRVAQDKWAPLHPHQLNVLDDFDRREIDKLLDESMKELMLKHIQKIIFSP